MALAPLRALNALIERNPVAAACTVTGGNATMADLLVQVVVEKRAFPEEIDARRTALFGTFGASYQGLFQYWMRVFSASRNLPKKRALFSSKRFSQTPFLIIRYNKLFERLWPGRTLKNNVCKILASNLISDPVFFFPTFYTFREVCNADALGPAQVADGLTKYSYNYWNDWLNSWTVWGPGYTVAYTVVPPHLRMPFIASVSFSYVCLLSSTRGSYEPPPPSGDDGPRRECDDLDDAPPPECRGGDDR